MKRTYLKEIVGLEPVKLQVAFLLDMHVKSGFMDNTLLVGGKGTGKTAIARCIGKELSKTDEGKREFVEINCSQLGSKAELFCSKDSMGDMILKNKPAVFYFDESHALEKKICDALLTILEVKSDDNKPTVYKWDGNNYTFNWKKHCFIFSTTDPQKMPEALNDRLEVINIPAYQQTELKAIMSYYLDGLDVADNALESLASVVRGNPRACVKLAKKIQRFMSSDAPSQLTLKQCKEIYHSLSIYPKGLTHSEVQILVALENNPNCSLTRLAAITGKSVQMLRRFEEMFLQKQGFMNIRTAAGRNLTAAGRHYLRNMEEDGYDLKKLSVCL